MSKTWGKEVATNLSAHLALEGGEDFVTGFRATLANDERFIPFRESLLGEAKRQRWEWKHSNQDLRQGYPAPCSTTLAGNPCGRSTQACIAGILGFGSKVYVKGTCTNCCRFESKSEVTATLPAHLTSPMQLAVCMRLSRITLRAHHSRAGAAAE